MKKTTIFLMLLFCAFFNEMSAQNKIKWDVQGVTTLIIRVNGVEQVNEAFWSTEENYYGGHAYGEFIVAEGATVQVIAGHNGPNMSATLEPIICEEGLEFWGATADYNFINSEHTAIDESFTMPPVDMVVYVKS